MKKIISVISTLAIAFSVLAFTVPASAAQTCTPTGFFRDSINMTAALIDPSGVVSGDVDATGCNVGVYYDNGTGYVSGANIHGANYFGVLVNGDANTVTVNVTKSSIHNIGDVPFSGDQHGVAVYYRSFGTGSVAGTISGNTISLYQKGGITANGNANVSIHDNTVTGNGNVDYIAQNGIQLGWGAAGQVQGNTVSGHSYTGTNYAADGGILIVGGPCYGSTGAYTASAQINKNILTNNDVGVYLSNLQADCVSAPTVVTGNKVVNNIISNGGLTNVSGYTFPLEIGYQAGISDQGDGDNLINNKISGIGYDPANSTYDSGSPANGQMYIIGIDAGASFTNNVKLHANVINP